MSQTYEQHTLEYFFKKYEISDVDKKASLLPLLTGMVFKYNHNVILMQKEVDAYKQKQLQESVEEYLQKIDQIMKGETELLLT